MPRAKSTAKAKKTPIKSKSKTTTIPSIIAVPKFKTPSWIKRNKYLQDRKVVITGLVIIVLLILILPHLVVAWVDNRPITIFEYYQALDSKYGTDTKEQLISERLVEDEAQKRGITVSQSEINDQVTQAEAQASGSANLDLALQQQGLTRAEFIDQVRLQLLIKKMFASEATVSSQEVDQYIAQNQDQLGPITDQTRQSVVDQLSQQKLVSAFQNWLSQAEQSNRVNRL